MKKILLFLSLSFCLLLSSQSGTVDEFNRIQARGVVEWPNVIAGSDRVLMIHPTTFEFYWVAIEDLPVSSSGGAENLGDLLDVTNSTPTNQYYLRANGTSWEAAQITFSDIDFGTPNTTQFLRKDGQWIDVNINPTIQNVLDNGSIIDAQAVNRINNSSDFWWLNNIGSDEFAFAAYSGIGVQDTANGDAVVLNPDLIRMTNNNHELEIKTDNLTGSREHQQPDGSGTYGLKINGVGFEDDGDITLNIPSTQLEYVVVTDSIYTMTQQDILDSKTYILKSYRADGVTPSDTITITYPSIVHDNSLLNNHFSSISGSAIKLIPDTNVVDYRSGTQKQYTTKKNFKGYAGVSSISQDSIWASSEDWTVSDYAVSIPSSNLYNFTNAASDDDSNSNTGWSDTSALHAISMVSTDVSDNYSIGIEAQSSNASDTASLTHSLPTLTVGVEYKATIRYKTTYDAATPIVQNPFFNWTNVSGATYPTTFSSGSFVEVEVIFTPTDPNPSMRIYPHWANGVGRTAGDLLEISSIVIIEN